MRHKIWEPCKDLQKDSKTSRKEAVQGWSGFRDCFQHLLALSSPSLHGPSLVIGVYELWGHYTKWNESDRKRQIPYELIYMWNLKEKTYSHRMRIYDEWWLTGGCQNWEQAGGGGPGGRCEVVQNGWRGQKITTSNYKIHKWWGYDVQHGNYG